jgi:hypothetical protein
MKQTLGLGIRDMLEVGLWIVSSRVMASSCLVRFPL